MRHVFDYDYTEDDLQRVIFQATFTSVFGFYACYSYVKSGTLLGPILLHVQCNTLQFPRFNYRSDGKLSNNMKKVYDICYLVGIGGFFIFIIFI